MTRFLPLLVLPLVLGMSPGCVTRYSVPSRALGTSVSVTAEHDAEERVLRTEVSAGEYPIERVRLIDARGREREPDAAVREGPELRGGVRLGGGIGTGLGTPGYGYGGVGIGTGTGMARTVGGRVVPGEYVARFLDPPLKAQPWTLRVTTGGDRRVTTDVLLAEIRNRDELEGGGRGVPLELKLVTGDTRAFERSRGDGGETLYEPVEPTDR